MGMIFLVFEVNSSDRMELLLVELTALVPWQRRTGAAEKMCMKHIFGVSSRRSVPLARSLCTCRK
jgi:hypothetical protein